MNPKFCYSWQEFDQDIKKIVSIIKNTNHPSSAGWRSGFAGVWGPARGGLVPAVALSHALGIPFLAAPTPNALIVDDIADTGKTLTPFKNHFIATLFYHKQSIVVPNIWLREKTDEWVIFPWEAS